MNRAAHALACAFAGALLLALEGIARASGGAAEDAYEGIDEHAAVDLHAFADVYAQRRLNASSQGDLQLRAFDTHAGAPSLELFRITAAHRPELLGFRVDAGVGDTTDAFMASDPASKDHPEAARALSYLTQAFVTVRVPVGSGIAIDVGKFSTPMGLEDNESWSSFDYSRSLLFTLAEPTVHSGMRATYVLGKRLALTAFWVNGWNANVLDGNDMRTGALGATWKPTPSLMLSGTYMAGPERLQFDPTNPSLAFRQLLGVNARYDLTGRIALAVSLDYGLDARAPKQGAGQSSFWGVAGYGRLRMMPWLYVAARAETFIDGDGVATGTPQRVAEGTVTLDATREIHHAIFTARLELRRDQSDQHVFHADGAPPSLRQDTLTFAVLLRL